MTLRQFYDWQTGGGAEDVSRLVSALQEREISWCMIRRTRCEPLGGRADATADADLVIASEEIEAAAEALRELGFAEKRFEWGSIHFKGDSKFSIQIRTEEMYLNYPFSIYSGQCSRNLDARSFLGRHASWKSYCLHRSSKNRTKKLKDIFDIGRLLDAHPALVTKLPDEIIHKINNP